MDVFWQTAILEDLEFPIQNYPELMTLEHFGTIISILYAFFMHS